MQGHRVSMRGTRGAAAADAGGGAGGSGRSAAGLDLRRLLPLKAGGLLSLFWFRAAPRMPRMRSKVKQSLGGPLLPPPSFPAANARAELPRPTSPAVARARPQVDSSTALSIVKLMIMEKAGRLSPREMKLHSATGALFFPRLGAFRPFFSFSIGMGALAGNRQRSTCTVWRDDQGGEFSKTGPPAVLPFPSASFLCSPAAILSLALSPPHLLFSPPFRLFPSPDPSAFLPASSFFSPPSLAGVFLTPDELSLGQLGVLPGKHQTSSLTSASLASPFAPPHRSTHTHTPFPFPAHQRHRVGHVPHRRPQRSGLRQRG